MRGVPLTPEQRAERNAARRALARAGRACARRLGTLALGRVLALFAWWLLTTFGGRDFLLRADRRALAGGHDADLAAAPKARPPGR